MPAGLAILDAPDIDSVEERNRTLAAQLLAAADLWLFVTSAARYADQVPWDFLKQAADRSTAVAIVLDRTPPEAIDTVAAHLARMLASRGLKDSPLFVVTEGVVDDDGPAARRAAVSDIRGWLGSLAARHRRPRRGGQADPRGRDPERRAAYPRRRRRARRAGRPRPAAARGRREGVRRRASRAIDEASADGTLLRGEVLARWQEFVGTGELLRSLESKVGRVRDRLVSAVKGKPAQAERVTVAVE